jgi:hypothetical protein
MTYNETFVHPSYESATESARARQIDLDDVVIKENANGMFGWVHQDDGFDVPSLDDGDDFSLSDTLDGMGLSPAEDGCDGEVMELDRSDSAPEIVPASELIHAESPGDTDATDTSKPTGSAYVYEIDATASDMLQVRMIAADIANRTGYTVRVVDTLTRDVVSVQVKSERKSKGSASRELKQRGPNERQQIIIRLCSREQGATSEDLRLALSQAGHAMTKNEIPWKQYVEGCTRYGYVSYQDAEHNGNRAITIYKLLSRANDHTAQEAPALAA